MKYFSLASSLSRIELIGFHDYVLLYHKQDSQIDQLCQWLATRNMNRIKSKNLTAKDLYSAYPSKKSFQSFSNGIATLGNLLSEYIAWLDWKNEPMQLLSNKLSGLASRSLHNEYYKERAELTKHTSEYKFNLWNNFYLMKSHFIDYHYEMNTNSQYHTEEFESLTNSFVKATSTFAQVLLMEMKNRSKIIDYFESPHYDFVASLYEEETDVNFLVDNVSKMLHDGEIDAFMELNSFIESSEFAVCSKFLKHILLTYCTVFLTRIIKKGNTDYAHYLLKLYQKGVESGLLSLKSNISFQLYNNIIGVSIKLGDIEWAAMFIKKYARKVDNSDWPIVEDIGNAMIDFHNEAYDKVINRLRVSAASDFVYVLKSKWLYLLAHFEDSMIDPLVVINQIDNFKRFIRYNEKKISASSYSGIRATLEILTMLTDQKDPKDIILFYETRRYVFERLWVSEKIKNLAP